MSNFRLYLTLMLVREGCDCGFADLPGVLAEILENTKPWVIIYERGNLRVVVALLLIVSLLMKQ